MFELKYNGLYGITALKKARKQVSERKKERKKSKGKSALYCTHATPAAS